MKFVNLLENCVFRNGGSQNFCNELNLPVPVACNNFTEKQKMFLPDFGGRFVGGTGHVYVRPVVREVRVGPPGRGGAPRGGQRPVLARGGHGGAGALVTGLEWEKSIGINGELWNHEITQIFVSAI